MTRTRGDFYIFVFLSLFVGIIANGITESDYIGLPPDSEDNAYQTTGFSNDYVSSGPILVIDKKTIFIPALNYNAESNDTYFWTGRGVPSANGTLVPDENNSTDPLRGYQGQNIYLQLPHNLTIDLIDYIAVWSVQEKTDLAHIILFKNVSDARRQKIPEALGYHNKTTDNKTKFRIPFCCGKNEIRSNGTCTPVDTDLKTDSIIIFESNETHIDPEQRLKNIELVPYAYFPECKSDSVRVIVEDIQGFIFNTSAIFYLDDSYYGLLSHESFCVLYRDITNPTYVMCVAASPDKASANLQVLYIPCLIISMICFIVTAAVYIFILKEKDIHRKCIVGYSVSMIITFVTLLCLQTVNRACNFIGSLFMISTICSFVWLTSLCIDLIFVVNPSSRSSDSYLREDRRIYIYLAASLAIPVIVLSASLIPDGIPDVPRSFIKMYSGDNKCDFGEVNQAKFFIPIGLLICASLVGLIYISCYIKTHKGTNDFYWIRNKSRYKFLLRSCFLLWLTTFIWLVEAVASQLIMESGLQLAINLIEALQGIFVLIIFVVNKYIRKEIYHVMNRKKYKMQQNAALQELQSLDKANTSCENDNFVKPKDTQR